MDFSFVVTVYNMERYVADCLDSIINQEYTSYKYEIIVINDGSTDSSLSIIQRYAKDIPNLKIIDQQNGGLSVARNRGLEVATGRWIWFIDSDDMISRSSLALIEKYAYNQNYDALVFSVENFSDTNRYLYADRTKLSFEKILSGREYLRLGIPCQVPFTIYNREYLIENKLRMMPGVYHEDMEFSPRAYYGLRQIGVIPDILYIRRITPNSITHSINWKKNFDCIVVADSLFKFSQTVNENDRVVFYDIASRVLDHSLLDNTIMDTTSKAKFVKIIKDNSALFKNMRNAGRFKYRIQGFLYSLFPNHIVNVYNFLYRFSHK